MAGELGRLSVFLDVDMRRFTAKMASAKQGLRGLSQSIKRNAAKWKSAGKTMMLAGTAMSAATGLMIKAAGDLEHAMLGVRKTTGYAGEQLEALRNNFRELSKEIPISSQELAEIGEVAGLLGIRGTKNITSFTEVSAKMATATKFTAEAAALSLARLSNAFKEPIENAENLGSAINELSNTTAANSVQIGDSMTRMAPAAAQLGLASHQVAAISATIVEVGMRARRVGTRMRRVFTQMATNYDKMAEEVGISASKFKQAILDDPVNALEMYLDAARKMPDVLTSLAVAQDIFGSAGAAAINQLVMQLPRLRDNLERSADAYKKAISLEEEFNNMMTGTWNQLKILRNRIGDVAVELGDVLLPIIKEDIIPAIESFTEKLTNFIKANPKLVSSIMKLTAVLGPATIALGAFAFILPNIVGGLGLVSGALLKVIPILAIAAATVASVYFAFKKWDLAKALVWGFVEGVNYALEKLIDGITGLFRVLAKTPLIGNLYKPLVEQGEKAKASIQDVVDFAQKRQADLLKDQKDRDKEYEEGLKDILDTAIKHWEKKLADIGIKLNKNVKEKLKESIDEAKKLNDEIDKLKDKTTEAEKAFKEFFEQAKKDFVSLRTGSVKALATSFKDAFSGTLKGEIRSFGDFVTNITNSIRARWAEMVADMVTRWMFGQEAMAKGTMGGSGSLFSGIAGLIGSFFGGGVSDPKGSYNVGYGAGSYPGGYSGMSGLGSHQHGTQAVPATGMYKLHKGESVTPRPNYGGGSVTIVNMITPDFVAEAMKNSQSKEVIVNTISGDLMRRGQTHQVIKREM